MLPSAIAPPISTIRSRLAPPGRSASSSATFVSGPTATSGRAARVLGEEVDRVHVERRAARRRQLGPVEAGLAVHVRGDERLADERPVGAGGDRHIGPPTRSSTRIAFAVVFSSVWLPETVVTPSSSSSGLASASRIAIASS